MKDLVENIKTKIKQLTNKINQYGIKISNKIKSRENNNTNNNNNNHCNSNNNTNKNMGGLGAGWIGNSVNNYCVDNNNNLQVRPGTISKGWIVFGNEDHRLKHSQKSHVTKLIPPEGKGPTMITNYTVKFELLHIHNQWYKKGKKYHHTTDIHIPNTKISHNQGGDYQGNLAIDKSVQHYSINTTSGHPYDALVFHSDWCVTQIPVRL